MQVAGVAFDPEQSLLIPALWDFSAINIDQSEEQINRLNCCIRKSCSIKKGGDMANRMVWEPKGLVHYFSGVLTGKELVNAVEAAHADPRFDDASYAIADFTGCTGLLVTADEDAYLVAIAGVAASNRRRSAASAFVVSDPQLFENFDRFIASPLSPPGTRRFSTLDEARRWAMPRS